MSYAVLVVDMLHEFVHGRLRSPQAEKIVPNIKLIISEARQRGVPVIYLADAHLPVDAEFKIWGPHALKGSEEARIIDELRPQEKDIVIEKRWYSGFRGTGLDVLLRDLNVDTVIVTGIHTHICVLHTVADAFYYRFNIIVVKDAVAAFSDEDHKYALKYMEQVYGAKLLSTDEVVNILRKTKVSSYYA